MSLFHLSTFISLLYNTLLLLFTITTLHTYTHTHTHTYTYITASHITSFRSSNYTLQQIHSLEALKLRTDRQVHPMASISSKGDYDAVAADIKASIVYPYVLLYTVQLFIYTILCYIMYIKSMSCI